MAAQFRAVLSRTAAEQPRAPNQTAAEWTLHDKLRHEPKNVCGMLDWYDLAEIYVVYSHLSSLSHATRRASTRPSLITIWSTPSFCPPECGNQGYVPLSGLADPRHPVERSLIVARGFCQKLGRITGVVPLIRVECSGCGWPDFTERPVQQATNREEAPSIKCSEGPGGAV